MNNFKISQLSLRTRIFLSMIIVILIASILMASISIIQFKNEARDYHQERLDRKEFAIKEHINYVLSNSTYPLTERNLPYIFKDKIHELSDIHNVEINIYSLDGKLLKSSKASFSVDKIAPPIPNYIIKLVQSSIEKRYVDIKNIYHNSKQIFEVKLENGKTIRTSEDHKFLCENGKMVELKNILRFGLRVLSL